ncbi:MAG: N-acetyltransferase [Bacillota bacterium]|jgi:hypothetical protein
MSGYKIISLADLNNSLEDEGRVREILSSFSCPYNQDIEFFIKKKALEFDKQGISSTHLVLSSYKEEDVIVGYFTLANKYLQIKRKNLSKSYFKKAKKFGVYQSDIDSVTISMPLIAQLSKNFSKGYDNLITGDELLFFACEKVREAQQLISGRLVYIECEDKENLLSFYSDNGFVNIGKRELEKSEKTMYSGKYLIQMMKYLHDDRYKINK